MKPATPPSAKAHEKKRREQQLDDALDDSFPASDPLPTSPMTTGAPKRAEAVGQDRSKEAKARKRS